MRASWTRVHSILLGLIMAVFLLLLLGNLGSISSSVSAIFKPRYGTVGSKSSGPSASWKDMLAIAQAEAQKVDKDALLDGTFTFAVPAGDQPLWERTFTSYTSSLKLVFSFITSRGNRILVALEDAAPAATVEQFATGYDGDIGYKHSQDISAWLNAGFARTKITPRDAVQRTWEEAKQRAAVDGLHGIPIIPQGVHFRIKPDKVPVWQVDYIIEKPTTKTPTDGGESDKLFLFSALFTVNAETGEIIERNFDE